MSDLLAFVLSGLVSGALYALLATGLVLSYSTSGLFNFAHGATAYLCALAFYELHSGLGWPAVPTALLLVCVVSPLLGWGLDRLMFRKLARVGETAQIVATIGLLVALPALGLWVVELLDDAGVSVKPAENQFGLPGVGPSPAKNWQLMDGVGIDSDQLITWVATAAVALGLWILMRHTTLGLRLRAAVDNRSLVELRGMSADRLSTVAWMLSSGLAGLMRRPRDPAARPVRPRLHPVPVRVGDRRGPRAVRLRTPRLRGRTRPRRPAEPRRRATPPSPNASRGSAPPSRS